MKGKRRDKEACYRTAHLKGSRLLHILQLEIHAATHTATQLSRAN